MVNGFIAMVLLVGIAGLGGLANGILHYSGNLMPRHVKKVLRTPDGFNDVETNTLMLGVVGNMLIGIFAGIGIFLWVQKDVPIFQHFAAGGPTGTHGLLAFFGGMSGTFVLDKGLDWFEKRSVGAAFPEGAPKISSEGVSVRNLLAAPRISVALAKLK